MPKLPGVNHLRAVKALEKAGFLFYPWPTEEGPCIRLVTAFDTEARDADGLIGAIRAAAA